MWNFYEIRKGAYFTSIPEIVFEQIGPGTLLVVSNYMLGLSWRNDCIHQFGFHSTHKNDSLFVIAVLLKFDLLCLCKISLLQDFSSDFVHQTAVYKCSLYCQFQEFS